MIRLISIASWIVLICSLQACSQLKVAERQICSWPQLSIEKDFEAGAFGACYQLSSTAYQLSLYPENTPINSSPWYAFKLMPNTTESVSIKLDYSTYGYKHRYQPKISIDKINWQLLDRSKVEVSDDKKSVWLHLGKLTQPVWIAAQPIIDNAAYEHWMKDLAGKDVNYKVASIGNSVDNRSIYQLSSISNVTKPFFVILGRQHPPELTGAIAMMAFVERLLADETLAQQFRQHFNLLIYPNINPDGVALGYWRHNVNGIDLNRDWGPFSQPETRVVKMAIEQHVDENNLWTMLDFHSTKKDIFYTQKDTDYRKFNDFIPEWIAELNQQQSYIQFKRQASHNAGKPTAKSYFFNRYQVPSTTFELNDKSQPIAIKEASIIAAEQFMRWWLVKIQHR